MVSDEQLVQAMARGDQAAFEAFVHRYHGPLQKYLFRMLHRTEKAEDFVQETFLRLIRQLRQGNVPDQVRPWLYRVALNLCRDYWKSLAFRNEATTFAEPPETKDTSTPVVEIYERQETRREMMKALDDLPEAQKEVIILRFYQDLKLQDIADILELPLGSVKTSLYNGLKKLKVKFESKSTGGNPYARSHRPGN